MPAVVDHLVDPGAHGVAAAPDPWRSLDLAGYDPQDGAGLLRRASVEAWLAAMFVTPRPLEEWMRWFWHGHFVSTLGTVKDPRLMVGQLRMLGAEGLGDFRTLLRAVTVDAAMLVYLDGTDSRIGEVNENYGREVLELFALGVGNYSEDDVRAGATALTGWHVDRRDGSRRVRATVPRRHPAELPRPIGGARRRLGRRRHRRPRRVRAVHHRQAGSGHPRTRRSTTA